MLSAMRLAVYNALVKAPAEMTKVADLPLNRGSEVTQPVQPLANGHLVTQSPRPHSPQPAITVA